MTLKDALEAAAVYAPAIAGLAVCLRYTFLQLLKRFRAMIREEQEPLRTQLTGIDRRVEIINGSVADVIEKAERIDIRTAALENIEVGKAISRAEMASEAASRRESP